MAVHLLKSDYYSRVFIGKTADKPNTPEKDGDIFISVDDDEVYTGYGGSWYQLSSVTVAL